MSNQQAAVVHSVNQTLEEHDRDVDDTKKMSDYGYEPESMDLFLRAVRKKLARDGYAFTFDEDDETFLEACCDGIVSDLKTTVNRKTKKV